jgi:hypothetical protein
MFWAMVRIIVVVGTIGMRGLLLNMWYVSNILILTKLSKYVSGT